MIWEVHAMPTHVEDCASNAVNKLWLLLIVTLKFKSQYNTEIVVLSQIDKNQTAIMESKLNR